MQVADGPANWLTIAPNARQMALKEGMIDPAYVEEGPDGSVHIAQDEPTPEQEINGFTYAFMNGEWVVVLPDGCGTPPPLTAKQKALLRSLVPLGPGSALTPALPSAQS